MTDEHLDRRIRDADPYRPQIIAHLDGTPQTLLEEIMSEPPVAAPWHRSLSRRSTTALAAAATLVSVLAVSVAFGGGPADDPQATPAASATPDQHQAAGPSLSTSSSASPSTAGAALPRLLINEPGWTVTTVYGFTDAYGTIAFANGNRQLEMNWYRAQDYNGYYTDRLEVSPPEPVTVDGWAGNLFRYSANDFAVMLRPRGDSFVEMRAQGRWTRTTFDKILTKVKRVDVKTWLAAMPDTVVTPDRVQQRAADVLADVPLPPGFDPATLNGFGTNDPYQFGAKVTGRVGCAWIAEWHRAKQAGDDAALRKADDALRSSHQWNVLHQMNDEGDWPESFWEIADQVAAGAPPTEYQQALGCT